MKRAALFLAVWVLSGSATAKALVSDADPAAEFVAIAAGSWTSREQSVDPRYDWVESETVRILPDRTDGVWLYQENAILASSPVEAPSPDAKDRPYFQIVIQLRSLGPEVVHSTTYRIDTPEARAGARGLWKVGGEGFDASWIGGVACMNELRRVAEGFWTGEADCPNTYKGAVRVDSRSVRTPDSYVNWDRGFDAKGQYVWGPVSGGYIFLRKETPE